ncbi:alpha/beta fold hydrolase [Elizabethkingia argentiflava]|uniref:Alpha/beta fold hydrolase n=1 Tax=Elizabethkingia argenteiflava TaxID=2681556 RepID=A0A845PY36_9FLAO|nr:alpha/beta fold hydrolase [Elizabethkingia argenteiflava]NAW51377.1 alpha/beta fold hydrolase [Elizabethkingia argenteiflava]
MRNKFILFIVFITFQSVNAQAIEKIGEEFLQNFHNKKYDVCTTYLDASILTQLNEKTLQEIQSQLTLQIGDFIKINSHKKDVINGKKSIVYHTDFSRSKIDIRLTFSEKDKIIGFFFTPSSESNKVFPQTPKPPFDYPSEEVNFINPIDGNTLAGTLCLPEKWTFQTPLYVLITGSGAQNRDSEIYGHKPFAVIADYLAKNNIASLRLDDRGIGGSSPGKNTDTSENFATDITAAFHFLEGRGFTNIGLIGHSEGGAIAAMVAAKEEKIRNIILLAAPGLPGNELLILQNKRILEVSGVSPEQIKEDLKLKSYFFNFVRTYKGNQFAEDAHKALNNFFIENKNTDSKKAQELISHRLIQQTNPWMVYFLKSTPTEYLKQLKIPVLALNGSLDTQVTAKENLEAIRKALLQAENKAVEMVEIPGLNHLFQTAKSGSPSEYEEIEETFSPKVLELIKNWVHKHQKTYT